MRERMERFVLLPFAAGCISESSIAVGLQQAKGSKTREEEEEYEEDEENLKSPSSLLALPRFQKLLKNFKNLSHSFVYKDDGLEETEKGGMEIGGPTDVKHVTHIGLDGCATSILSKGWKTDTDNLPSFPSTPLERADNTTIRSLLEENLL